MDPNGSNQVNLTNDPDGDYAAAWSPDGAQIAFYRDDDVQNDIYAMDANGANQVNLTNPPGNGLYPDWQPTTPTPTPTATPTEGPQLTQGDVDCNGNVTSVDALKELRFVAQLAYTQNEPCPDIGTDES